ncbi:hypothetical protein BGP_3845 [Beggiatoa sp. PS]|nr:hypothetical protein BGP_3845 [Beggiatoa sp. PS]
MINYRQKLAKGEKNEDEGCTENEDVAEKSDGILNFFTQVLVCNDDLKRSEFYDFCLKNQQLINDSHIGFKVTKDFLKVPGKTLG